MLRLPITQSDCHDDNDHGDRTFNEGSKVRRRGATALPSSTSTTNHSNGDHFYQRTMESKFHAFSCVQRIDRILSGLSRHICRQLSSLMSSCGSFSSWLRRGLWALVSFVVAVPTKSGSCRIMIQLVAMAGAGGSLGWIAIKWLQRIQRTPRRMLWTYSHLQIVFYDASNSTTRNRKATTTFHLPRALVRPVPKTAFYNGLVMTSLVRNETPNTKPSNQSFQREILSNAYETAEDDRSKELSKGVDATIPYQYWYQEDMEGGVHRFLCRKVSWVKLQFLNCNAFHEVSIERDYSATKTTSSLLQPYDIYLVNHGFYRDIWVNQHPGMGTDSSTSSSSSILKTTRYQFDFGWRNLFDVHREALIMERLTAFDNIVSPYGHCGTSVLTEALPHEVERYIVPGRGYYHQPNDRQAHNDPTTPEAEVMSPDILEPRNTLSVREKLETALAMAESIAVLHGHVDGVVVHDDIQLQQWLRAADSGSTLKLGDFNRATILDWNDKEQRYCKFSNGEAFGNYRSPEEFIAGDLDEKIDVYSFSNNIYCLLTGLWPFYDIEDDSVVQRKVLSGERALVPRHGNQSLSSLTTAAAMDVEMEHALMDTMQKGWIHKPNERIDIFEAVRLLKAAMIRASNGTSVSKVDK